MTEKIRTISNPLTIIAIFAALAEINATVSISLVDKELQAIFIWFVISFPTLLVAAFFFTLNFNTKVIYAPSDYKDDKSFHIMLRGDQAEPDKEITDDKNIINKTLNELGINKEDSANTSFEVPDNVSYLFSVRYSLEKEIRRLVSNYKEKSQTLSESENILTTGIHTVSMTQMLSILTKIEVITPSQSKALRNVYLITSHAIHGNEQQLTVGEIEFVKQVAPGLIDELKKIM